jgi:hypothetical protein
MEIVYNWEVSSMQEYPKTADDLTDVVFLVYWVRNATAVVDEKTYVSDLFGSLAVPAPDPADFTPYPDLTFEQVCGWLDAGLDVEAIDFKLAANIENQINPTVVELPLPWVPQPVPPQPEPPTPEITEPNA